MQEEIKTEEKTEKSKGYGYRRVVQNTAPEEEVKEE